MTFVRFVWVCRRTPWEAFQRLPATRNSLTATFDSRTDEWVPGADTTPRTPASKPEPGRYQRYPSTDYSEFLFGGTPSHPPPHSFPISSTPRRLHLFGSHRSQYPRQITRNNPWRRGERKAKGVPHRTQSGTFEASRLSQTTSRRTTLSSVPS